MVVANQCQRPVASFEHQRCECSLQESGGRRCKYIKVKSLGFSFRLGLGGGRGETTPKKTQAADIGHFGPKSAACRVFEHQRCECSLLESSDPRLKYIEHERFQFLAVAGSGARRRGDLKP
jgi:hypothetical protein